MNGVRSLSPKTLQLPTDGLTDEWPPRIDTGGVTIFLVQLRALPQAAASMRGPAKVVTITKDDLLRVDAPEEVGK